MSVQTSSHPALSGADSLANATSDFLLLFGRILLGWIFVRSGYGKLFDIAGYGASFPARGLPFWLVYVAVPVEFFGGLALLLGFATRYVAIVMAIFIVVASFSSHAYWLIAEAAPRRINESQFWKNISMLGGFVIFFVTGPGRFSADGWLRKR
jgi:putative oxidoreductase